MQKGDKLVMRMGGGAGYGDPAERDGLAQQQDQEDGLLAATATPSY